MKKFLLSLCVWFLWIISFCNADVTIPNPIDKVSHYVLTWDWNYSISYHTPSISNYYYVFTDKYCGWSNCYNFQCGYSSCKFDWYWNNFLNSNTLILNTTINSNLSCRDTCTLKLFNTSSVEFYLIDKSLDFSSSCPECPVCPEVNTWEILSWYILESSIDTNYCVWNWLCPNECWSWTDFSWDLQYSNLYINNILHPWKENIFLNIQDNIFWDYSQDDTWYYIDVGSGYDQDYIDWVIDVQSYRPTSEDFTQTFVGGLILFTPYVVILLFVILVWNLIKKIFKTK